MLFVVCCLLFVVEYFYFCSVLGMINCFLGIVLEVEKDYTIYGDECKFGGGKGIAS